MGTRTIWLVDSDPTFRQHAEDVSRRMGFQYVLLEEAPSSPSWREEDILIIDAEHLPVRDPPGALVSLVVPGREVTQIKTSGGAARWFLSRNPVSLSQLLECLTSSEGSGVYGEESLAERFAALQRVAGAVSEATDLPEIFDRVRDALNALLEGAQNTFLFVPDETRETLRPLVLRSDHPVASFLTRVLARPLSDIRLPLAALPVEWREQIPKGRPCCSVDPVSLLEQVVGAGMFELSVEQVGVGSIVVLPLRSGGLLRGLIVVPLERRYICREDLELGSAVAKLVAAALESQALLLQARRRIVQLDRLYELAQAMAASNEPAEVATLAVQQFVQVLGMERARILLWERADDALQVIADVFYDYDKDRYQFEDDVRLYPLANLISARQVLENQHPLQILASDARADLHGRATMPPERVATLVMLPLVYKGESIGLVEVGDSLGAYRLAPDQMNLAMTLAAQVAAVLENARLYQEIKTHAAELEEAYALLQEMDKLKEEMIQNVSHELRVPLTFLKAYVDLLVNGELGPLTSDQRQSLNVVARKTEQLTSLVQGVVTLEVVGPETMETGPVDMYTVIHRAIEDWSLAATRVGIDLRYELPENIPLILGDGLRVGQVLDNLLSNAVKFCPGGGTITLRARQEEDWLRVEVSDTGIGIPEDKLPYIFGRFFQVDGSTQRRFGGVGLGLAIVKHIVQLHGGEVGVESVLGEGSTFYFTLPVFKE